MFKAFMVELGQHRGAGRSLHLQMAYKKTRRTVQNQCSKPTNAQSPPYLLATPCERVVDMDGRLSNIVVHRRLVVV